jgi:hypothetical protein
MTNFTLGHSVGDRGLIPDLNGVNCLVSEGFPEQQRVAFGCAQAGTLPAARTGDVALALVLGQIAVRLGPSRAARSCDESRNPKAIRP